MPLLANVIRQGIGAFYFSKCVVSASDAIQTANFERSIYKQINELYNLINIMFFKEALNFQIKHQELYHFEKIMWHSLEAGNRKIEYKFTHQPMNVYCVPCHSFQGNLPDLTNQVYPATTLPMEPQ